MTRKRNEFPTAVKVEAWKRCDGKCENCGVALKRKAFDHVDPDAISRRNDLGNCQVLCLRCHAEKTRADVAAIAKVKRIEARHVGAARPKAKIAKRPAPPPRRQPKPPLAPRPLYREAAR